MVSFFPLNDRKLMASSGKIFLVFDKLAMDMTLWQYDLLVC